MFYGCKETIEDFMDSGSEAITVHGEQKRDDRMQMGRWLGVILVSVLAVAGCVSAYAESETNPSAGTGSMNRLNLMSYNIKHCARSDGKVDFRRVADAIMRENPDFVALNEVDCRSKRSGEVDEAAELGRLAGFHATFAKAIPHGGGAYGNAVLSREKPLSVVRVPLPGREPRVLLLCEFPAFWFGTAHLDFGKYQIKAVDVIRGVVEEKAKGKPVFLTGDWNADPKSKTLMDMREFMTVLSREDRQTFHGFKTDLPQGYKHCIDYIAIDSAHAENVKVDETHVTQNFTVSDHNPVIATVRLINDVK